MAAKERTGSRPGETPAVRHAAGRDVGRQSMPRSARLRRGSRGPGRHVPGIVVGYNIASFGNFMGNAYPLVVRTALGVTKCSPDELSLV
jgi:hypothetical protein